MRITLYGNAECAECKKIEEYLRYAYPDSRISIRDADAIQNHPNRILCSGLHGDYHFQGERLPLVYFNKKYQELDSLLAKVKAWQIAHSNDGDNIDEARAYIDGKRAQGTLDFPDDEQQ